MVIDFSIILLYFVEIYIHRIHDKKMACVEWQDEMAKIKIKEQKLQKVEGKGFFFIFLLENCLGL